VRATKARVCHEEEAMGYKTILVHCDASRTVEGRLTVAAGLAERFEARLVGLHAREPFEVISFVDGGMGVAALTEAYQAGYAAAEKTARTAFDKVTTGRALPVEWRVVEAFSDEQV
jgi:nucleotide-binding universal stress UspA family protein